MSDDVLRRLRSLVYSQEADRFRDEACRHAVDQPYADNRYVRLLDDLRRLVDAEAAPAADEGKAAGVSDEVMARALLQAAHDPRVLMCMDIGREVACEKTGVFVPTVAQWEVGLRTAAYQLPDLALDDPEVQRFRPSLEPDGSQQVVLYGGGS